MFEQRLGLAGVRAAGMRGGSHGIAQILFDFLFPARAKAFVFQKVAIVQLADQPLDIRKRDTLAELPFELLLDLGQRAVAIHQRGQAGCRVRNYDRAGKTFRVAQGEQHFAVGSGHRKAFDRPQTRPH